MILLDTNVISELMRPAPDRKVIDWLDAKPESDIWISSISMAEIHLGIALLPDGKRKEMLLDLTEKMVREDFSGKCLPFDCEASVEYAWIVSKRNRNGHPISVEDAQIAAIALFGELTLATRNVKDFTGIEGLDVVNPWT
jgi:hypothetical protein